MRGGGDVEDLRDGNQVVVVVVDVEVSSSAELTPSLEDGVNIVVEMISLLLWTVVVDDW